MSKYNKYKSEILRMHSELYSNVDIGNKLGIDSRRVSAILRKEGLRGNGKTRGRYPNKLEHEYLTANAIGDGSIFKGKENKNYRMNLAHSLEQKDYFIMKYEAVKDFIKVGYTKESQFDKRTNKTYHYLKYQTRTHPYFTELYKKWYLDGRPIISDEIQNELTERVLALKYFDDGFKTRNGFSISMNSYDELSINKFRKAMLINHDIETNLHRSTNDIYIPASQTNKFKDIILPHATEDVLYKLGEFKGTPNE